MRIFNVLMGILCIIAAGVCFMHPFESQIMYGYTCSIIIGIMGVISIVEVIMTRKERKAARAAGLETTSGVLGVVLGILGIVFMLLNMNVPFFTYAVAELGAVVLMLYLLFDGGLTVIGAFLAKESSMGTRILLGILGVLMIIVAFWGIGFPAVVISMFGTFLAIGFAVAGINRFVLAFSN